MNKKNLRFKSYISEQVDNYADGSPKLRSHTLTSEQLADYYEAFCAGWDARKREQFSEMYSSDGTIGGYKRGELAVIMGNSGVGKSKVQQGGQVVIDGGVRVQNPPA